MSNTIREPRRVRTILSAIAVGLLAAAIVSGPALAARGGGGGPKGGGGTNVGGGTIALATPLVVDNNGNGLPDYTDVVTFNISTAATTTPYVNLVCTQNGVLVASGWRGYWDGSLDTSWNFGLESGAWPGGAADCTAYLKMQTKSGWSILASTSFPVGA
jgi:hypothetical protein